MEMSNKINSLIEAFITQQNSSITEDACAILERLQKLDESHNITDQVSVDHYVDKVLEQSKPSEYKWLNEYCPYFTIEESESFRGYYSKSYGPSLASFLSKIAL